MYQEDYLLAKVGVCADRHSWSGYPLPEAPVLMEEQEGNSGKADGIQEKRSVQDLSGSVEEHAGSRESALRSNWFLRRRQERERKREHRRRQREYIQKLQEYEDQREEMEESIRQLWREVFREVERADGMGAVSCAYEESLRFLTAEQGEAARCWGAVWNLPEFGGYRELRWARPLLEYARHPDFILLGAADCIPAILRNLARRMKSLQWYLAEKDLEEALEQAEDFYEEYGLAANVRSWADRAFHRRLELQSLTPVCVMDFTDGEKLFVGKLAAGSLWIDFASVEEKARRVGRQSPETAYISLKRHWSAAAKRQPVFPESFRFRSSYPLKRAAPPQLRR